jgi:hypothetical protein
MNQSDSTMILMIVQSLLSYFKIIALIIFGRLTFLYTEYFKKFSIPTQNFLEYQVNTLIEYKSI